MSPSSPVLDRATLQATAYVIPKPNANAIWEGHNQNVVTQAASNTLIDLGTAHDQVGTFNLSAHLYSGTLTAGFCSQAAPMTGSGTGARQEALVSLSFTPDPNQFFGNAQTLELSMAPEFLVTWGYGTSLPQSHGHVVDGNNRAIITLTRQADGKTYQASAPANKAFLSAISETGINGSSRQTFVTWIRNPAGGDPDSHFQLGYELH